MSKWNVISLEDLINTGEAELQTGPFGTQLNAGEYVEHGIPVVNVRNIGFGKLVDAKLEYIGESTAARLKVHMLEEKDLVFCRKGAVERHLFVPKSAEGWIQGSDCMRLRLKSNKVSVNLLSYYFLTAGHKDWMEAQCSFGATMSSLNQGVIRRIKISLPPLPIQRKIAGILSAYDDLIENNTRRIALLEKMAEEVYREWFVRLRFPGHAQVSVHQGVPEGWEIKSVKDIVFRLPFGQIYNENELSAGGEVVVIDQSRRECLGYYNGEPSHNATMRNPIIVFGDHSCKIQLMIKPFSLAENVVPFTGNSEIYTLFLYNAVKYLVKTSEYKRHWMEFVSKEVLVPPEILQQRFVELIASLVNQDDCLKQSSRKLKSTRDRLLPRLLSGKLDVESLDIRFPLGMRDMGQTHARP